MYRKKKNIKFFLMASQMKWNTNKAIMAYHSDIQTTCRLTTCIFYYGILVVGK